MVFRHWGCGLLAGVISTTALARSETQVTTYVIKVQEEREQTRWTLTEWLRIKERMKMMDVWLAMFSDPKRDKFQPELMLSYNATRSQFHSETPGKDASDGALTGNIGKAQLWLTNLISGTVGVRMLNVDFGAEGYHRQAGELVAASKTSAAVDASEAAPSGKLVTEYYTGNLRIFGRNIQDSSLVLKYGHYTTRNSILDSYGEPDTQSIKGTVGGAELQVYVLRWLGAEANYLKFGDTNGAQGTPLQSGTYYDYSGFIEISLLRLTAGLYQEDWTVTRLDQPVKTQEKGTMAGLKLQF